MNLGESFHDEASVEVINEIAHSVDCVGPGTVRILRFQDEIQIPFGNFPIGLDCQEVAKRWSAKKPDKPPR